MRTEFVLQEVGIGLKRNVTMTIAAVMTVAISLTLLGIALIIRFGADQLEHDLLNQIEVSVYLQPVCGTPQAGADCLTADDRTSIEATLRGLPQVENVTYISQADGFKRFKEEFRDSKDLVDHTPESAIPESFAVKLKDPHQFAVITSAVGRAPGVQSVQNASSTLKRLFAFFHHVTLGALLLTVLLLISTCLLIYNSMRVAAFSRRRETGIMRLVGASDFYIQAPFVLEGTAAGVAGSGLAVLLLIAVKWYISSTLATRVLTPFGEWSTLAHALPIVIVIGILLPAIASFLTLQRHLRV
ncbi:MAG TPA: permease-like cell division protein FtsX [Mycobacteriales bacterium]|jgi:cell division transport system permease protein|nr:permease-like cell division protein FtsX [Mycobacteriales bacterium]